MQRALLLSALGIVSACHNGDSFDERYQEKEELLRASAQNMQTNLAAQLRASDAREGAKEPPADARKPAP